MTVNPTQLLTIEAVQDRLSVGRSTVVKLIADKRLQSVTVGRRRLIPETSLQAFVDSLMETEAAQ